MKEKKKLKLTKKNDLNCFWALILVNIMVVIYLKNQIKNTEKLLTSSIVSAKDSIIGKTSNSARQRAKLETKEEIPADQDDFFDPAEDFGELDVNLTVISDSIIQAKTALSLSIESAQQALTSSIVSAQASIVADTGATETALTSSIASAQAAIIANH